jgi:hypothetical protein
MNNESDVKIMRLSVWYGKIQLLKINNTRKKKARLSHVARVLFFI